MLEEKKEEENLLKKTRKPRKKKVNFSVPRVNLTLSLDTLIRIDIECERRNFKRTDFIKNAVIKSLNSTDWERNFSESNAQKDIDDLKNKVDMLAEKIDILSNVTKERLFYGENYIVSTEDA